MLLTGDAHIEMPSKTYVNVHNPQESSQFDMMPSKFKLDRSNTACLDLPPASHADVRTDRLRSDKAHEAERSLGIVGEADHQLQRIMTAFRPLTSTKVAALFFQRASGFGANAST
jgi:hypothetical protein